MITAGPVPLASEYAVVVVGGGSAGLEAVQMAGADCVRVVDGEQDAGGLLPQCIHAGFGLHRFGDELTGPEQAQRVPTQAHQHDIDVLKDVYVLDIDAERRVKLLALCRTPWWKCAASRASAAKSTPCRSTLRRSAL